MTLADSTTLEMYRGETRVWTLTITEDGSAVNLTGATVSFTVREIVPGGSVDDDTDATFTCVTPTEILLTLPTTGVCELVVLRAKTYDLDITTKTTYRYGCVYTLSGETEPHVAGQGDFIIYPSIARAL